MNKYYYVTTASGKKFIKTFAQYSIKSLIKTGVPISSIHVVVNTEEDKNILLSLIKEKINIYIAQRDLSIAKWKYAGGIRKYSLLKAFGLHKFFTKPLLNKYMIYFDGDVLWYKNPTSFFDERCNKTWFHHGKSLSKRSKLTKQGYTIDDIDISNYKMLSKWCSAPQAHLMVKYGAKIVPKREVVAGLYLLHPKDHEQVIKWTYKGCIENCGKFIKHEGGGDQKPMNAALSIAEVDWHGGSRFLCPDHKLYFDHFFGVKKNKKKFVKKWNEIS